jgi:hypothetical protein
MACEGMGWGVLAWWLLLWEAPGWKTMAMGSSQIAE